MKATRKTPVERLWSHVIEQPDGCVEWTGCTDRDGYGRIRFDGKTVGTHQLAWILANGPIPDGMCVLHHCDNPPCCQTEPTEGFPDGHLFLGTHADNMADREAKGRCRSGSSNSAKTHCLRGHPFSEANTSVTSLGQRQCRACVKVRYLARQQTKGA